jgi:hypothetical protein
MYAQTNSAVELNSDVVTAYVECLVSFGEMEATLAKNIVCWGRDGVKSPCRAMEPDARTEEVAERVLREAGYGSIADKLMEK